MRKTFVCASESCALDAVGAQYVRDILPGEMVYSGEHHEGLQSYIVKEDCERKICAFEYIYFARPDSTLENINVHEIREKSGEKFGNKLL